MTHHIRLLQQMGQYTVIHNNSPPFLSRRNTLYPHLYPHESLLISLGKGTVLILVLLMASEENMIQVSYLLTLYKSCN